MLKLSITLAVAAAVPFTSPEPTLRPHVEIVVPHTPLMVAIATIEGWRVEGTAVRRWRNPGALVFAGQAGATRNESGYAVFGTEEEGWEALRRDIAAKFGRGLDIPALARARCGTDPECDARLYAETLSRMLQVPANEGIGDSLQP